MGEDSAPPLPGTATLGEAFQAFIESLKPEQRSSIEPYVRRYVDHVGRDAHFADVSSSKVESYVESQIRPSDPAAPDRVQALKLWFQFLKKRGYAEQNYGISVRIRKSGPRQPGGQARVRVEAATIEMTREGREALDRELEGLTAAHPDLVKAVALAREDKDFRENAPLDAAREALAFNEQRRRALEATIKRSVIVEANDGDRSSVGSLVTVTRLDMDQPPVTYKLVSAREANAADKKISVDSPVGKQLLGRLPGEEVSVNVPSGSVIQYRVDSVARE